MAAVLTHCGFSKCLAENNPDGAPSRTNGSEYASDEDWLAGSQCQPLSCCPAARVQIDYLMWWGRGQNLPALVTTSLPNTVRDQAGVLGSGTETVLFGDSLVGRSLRSGGRITLQQGLDECNDTSVSGRFFGLQDARVSYQNASLGDPILARPFFNTQLPGEDSQLIAYPGVTTDGSVEIQMHNDVIGAEAFYRRAWARDGDFRIDWLLGYQFLRLDDSLLIQNTQSDIQGVLFPIGTSLAVTDWFRTRNEFHGGSVGFTVQNQCGPWRLDLLGKIALGNMRQTSIIAGSTIVTEPGDNPVSSSYGLLAQGTNSGRVSRDRLAFIPEFNADLAYQIDHCWSLRIGYSFMYWNNALLSGAQVDRLINLSQNPGPLVGETRPARRLQSADYWLQGLNFGLELRY